MDLWTEFEGATIDSAYSLKQLLQSEGRSAFFSTVNERGESVLIRIIECHFDEDEILARWRGLETLGHAAFLGIQRYGQFLIEEDGITAVYAVFERVDANLAQVLEHGRLTAADAAQIGRSVASALEMLHANGFVHEHVEARNIYAVGDVVKMRSDCIRETPEGEAGLEARRRDVRDLAVLLAQVLRGTAGARANGAAALPAPFDEIVRNGLSGLWGLEEIQAALTPPGSEAAPARKSGGEAAKEVRAEVAGGAGATRELAAAGSARAADAEAAEHVDRRAKAADEARDEMPLPGRRRASLDVPVIFGISQEEMRRWVTAAGLLLAVLLFGAIMIHRWHAREARANTQPQAMHPETAASQRAAASPGPAHSEPAQERAPRGASGGTPPAAAPRWRVVAFTYKRKDQAEKKVAALAHKYPSLWPAAFSPTGRAPWLVTIGGALERDAAYALARKARSLGLPRDTYAQNYQTR